MPSLAYKDSLELSTEFLEETLLMREWGQWARQGSGKVYPGWVNKIKPGYRESPKEMIMDIDDDKGLLIDGMIATLDSRSKVILVEIYVNKCAINKLQRILHTTRHIIRQRRDTALGVLYGMLRYKTA